MNTSKIKAIIQTKQSPKNGKRYTIIEMESGDKGTICHDNENQYAVGQELKYKINPTQDDPTKFWISEVKEKKGGGYSRDYKIDFVMKAMECAIAYFPNVNHIEGKPQLISEIADSMYNRMDKKYLSVKQQNNGK